MADRQSAVERQGEASAHVVVAARHLFPVRVRIGIEWLAGQCVSTAARRRDNRASIPPDGRRAAAASTRATEARFA